MSPKDSEKKKDNAQDGSNAESKEKSKVLEQIENIRNEIDDLLEKTPKDDPDYKKNIKKLNELKKILGKKGDPDKKNKSKTDLQQSSSQQHLESPSTMNLHEHHETRDFVNANLDDSLLYGIDNLLSAYEYIRKLIRK